MDSPGADARVGATHIARLFYAGRYEDVLRSTVDSERGGADAADRPFVVGALAFAGRVVEAELLLDGVRGRAGAARTLAAGGFFVAVALGRMGRSDDAARTLRRAVSDTRGRRDAWCRGLIHQGVAALRFFAGHYEAAEQSARRALQQAQSASFPYGLLLANDMRGHVLLKLGRHHEGLAVLERARKQAAQLDFSSNAEVIETALAVQRAALAPLDRALASLEAVVAETHAQDSYSRRTLLLELAMYRAFRGQASSAESALEEAAPLCAGSARARSAEACVRAHVARVRHGWEAAREHADRARSLFGSGNDPSRDAEVEGLLYAAAVAMDDHDERARAGRALRAIVERSHLARAAAWLRAFDDADRGDTVEAETLFTIFGAVRAGRVDRVLAEGWFGLLAEACGRSPARRLHVRHEATMVEDHGDVTARSPLPPRVRAVLLALADGEGERGRLLERVWGIRRYRPERHDQVIKTTLSRLRNALGAAGAWIVTDASGYRVAAGVEVLEGLAEHGSLVPPPMASPDDGHAGTARRHARWRKVLDELANGREASVRELAMRLGAPVRTMSRDLSDMLRADLVLRAGAGRATRYRSRVDPDHEALNGVTG